MQRKLISDGFAVHGRGLSGGEDLSLGGVRPVGPVLAPTPVYRLGNLGREWGQPDLWTKREDLTARGYGGNKVRNLAYIFGDALARGGKTLVTTAPLGSNFVAALAAHAPRFGFEVDVRHFIPLRTAQIEAHARFSLAAGAQLKIYGESLPLTLAAAVAGSAAVCAMRRQGAYFVAPGGSSVTGALGHVSAALELAAQIVRGEAPQPDAIVVGAGTCGTLAGLLAGLRLAGLGSVRVVGVRCVDRIVCNRLRIARLANALIERVDGTESRRRRLCARDIELLDVSTPYGAKDPQAAAIAATFSMLEDIALDTTYTTKVALGLRALTTSGGKLAGRRVLYWHTYGGRELA